MRLPIDELGLVASLRDAPLPVVKCVTNDIRVPADAEYVLEGYLDERGHVEPEGPYGEFLGYYGAVKRNPVFHLTAITRRKDALFQTSTIGGKTLGRTDTAQLSSLRTEVMIWRTLESAVREPVNVYATTSSGGAFNVRVALRQRVPGEARNAITACMGALANCKNVFVVDPDVDIFSDEQMDWAMATRFQPDRDLVVMSGMRTLPLDPSLPPGSRGRLQGGLRSDLAVRASRPDRDSRARARRRFNGRRFASVEAAIADGPKFFEELMAAVGSRDGREVVREIEALRGARGDRARRRRAILFQGGLFLQRTGVISSRRCYPGFQSFFHAGGSCESISTKQIRHGLPEVLTQAWLVPCCTMMSPALKCTCVSSSSMSISPSRQIA